MDIVMQLIGLGFIPLLAILVFGGINEIYQGLKEHLGFKKPLISEFNFNGKALEFIESFGFRKINIHSPLN